MGFLPPLLLRPEAAHFLSIPSGKALTSQSSVISFFIGLNPFTDSAFSERYDKKQILNLIMAEILYLIYFV